jgi:hypothetical protein
LGASGLRAIEDELFAVMLLELMRRLSGEAAPPRPGA